MGSTGLSKDALHVYVGLAVFLLALTRWRIGSLPPLLVVLTVALAGEVWDLIDNIRTEPDLTRRRAMVTTALRLVADDLPYIPLYRRTLTWAMQRKVTLVQWPNDTVELRWVRVR